MYLMSKMLRFLVLASLLLFLSGCGGPSVPKQNVVSYSYKTKLNSDFKTQGSICANVESKNYIKYKASLETLHKYLNNKYSDTELSASTKLVDIKSLKKSDNNCFKYEAIISQKNQKQLSDVHLDIAYYKVIPTKYMYKYLTMKNITGHDYLYGYIAAEETVPNMASVKSMYYKLQIAYDTTSDASFDKNKKIASYYDASYSTKKIRLYGRSIDLDQNKARFLANCVNAKADSLGRLYNNIYINFKKENGDYEYYYEISLGENKSFTRYLSSMSKFSNKLNIEVEYTLKVPNEFKSDKLYLSSKLPQSLDYSMFNISVNGVNLTSPYNLFITEYKLNKFNEKVLDIKITTKHRLKAKEYEKYLQELSNIPYKVGEYKRGGLETIQNTDYYILKK